MQAVKQFINDNESTFKAIYNFSYNVGLTIIVIIKTIIEFCKYYIPLIYKFLYDFMEALHDNDNNDHTYDAPISPKKPIIDNSWCNVDIKNIIPTLNADQVVENILKSEEPLEDKTVEEDETEVVVEEAIVDAEEKEPIIVIIEEISVEDKKNQ